MAWNPRRKRREREFARLDAFRAARRLAAEDVTVFGEQLVELDEAMPTDEPTNAIREDYQRALELHESAARGLRAATTTEGIAEVETQLTDGRFHLACALARRDSADLPTSREPCFFNPQHGPGVTEVVWTPPGGAATNVRACRADADRLSAGEAPDIRLVRLGDRYVPWYAMGGSITSVALHGTQEAYRGRTAQSDRYVTEARARGDMARMNEGLNP